MSSLAKRLDYLEPLVQASTGKLEKSVYGVVDRVDKIDGKLVPHFIRRWKGTIGNMETTDDEPTICLIEKLEPMVIREYPLLGGAIRVARMGFTADLGYECWMRPGLGEAFEQSIRSAREALDLAIPGYGLTALQACRLEGGFIVAGWDCATEADPAPGFERSPYELGLGWLVNLDAADFVGKDALRSQQQSGYRFTLRSFEIADPRALPDGIELYASIDGEDLQIGLVNCSGWSWGLDRMIGNASIESPHADLEEAWISVESEVLKVKLSRGPLMKFEQSRQVPAPIESA